MSRWKKVVIGIFLALAASAAVLVYLARHLTILRLARSSVPVVSRIDVGYVVGSDDPKHRLDVYMPQGARGVAVIHFVHGGYWTEGDKDYYRAITGLYQSVGEALARRGVGVVIQSYRLAPQVGIEGILGDVLSAVAWSRQNIAGEGGDPGRLFLMGHSAGGHLVSLVASDRSLAEDALAIRGVVSLSGILDVAAMDASQDEDFRDRVVRPVFGRDPAEYARRSPATHYGAGTPPHLFLLGEHDFPYLFPQTRSAGEKLASAGVEARVVEIAGNTHRDMVLRFGATNDNVTEPVVRFLEEVEARDGNK